MFKYLVFVALVVAAFAAPEPKAKPGLFAAAPLVAAAPVAYTSSYVAPAAYAAHYTSPYVYSAGYHAAPLAYSAYTAPIVY